MLVNGFGRHLAWRLPVSWVRGTSGPRNPSEDGLGLGIAESDETVIPTLKTGRRNAGPVKSSTATRAHRTT